MPGVQDFFDKLQNAALIGTLFGGIILSVLGLRRATRAADDDERQEELTALRETIRDNILRHDMETVIAAMRQGLEASIETHMSRIEARIATIEQDVRNLQISNARRGGRST